MKHTRRLLTMLLVLALMLGQAVGVSADDSSAGKNPDMQDNAPYLSFKWLDNMGNG